MAPYPDIPNWFEVREAIYNLFKAVIFTVTAKLTEGPNNVPIYLVV